MEVLATTLTTIRRRRAGKRFAALTSLILAFAFAGTPVAAAQTTTSTPPSTAWVAQLQNSILFGYGNTIFVLNLTFTPTINNSIEFNPILSFTPTNTFVPTNTVDNTSSSTSGGNTLTATGGSNGDVTAVGTGTGGAGGAGGTGGTGGTATNVTDVQNNSTNNATGGTNGPVTATGEGRRTSVPSPICPYVFLPKHCTLPAERRTHV